MTTAVQGFNKTNVKAIHKAIQKQIVGILTNTGITLEKFNGTYSDYHYRITLELRTTGKGGETKETVDYKTYMPTEFHSWLGQAMLAPDGNMYEVTGYRRGASKRPITISRVDKDLIQVCNVDFLKRCVLVED